MPVKACQRGGKKGFKWGDSGKCFVGEGARARALAVGRAIFAQRAKFDAEEEWSSQGDFEALVFKMGDEGIATALVQLPFLPEEHQASWVKKADEEMHVVWGEIYVPDIPDTQDEFMVAAEIEKMAHKFLMDGLSVGAVDVQHDGDIRKGCYIVESFIARKNDPEFIEGAWVVAMKICDDDLWADVKSGKLNGFSMQASVYVTDRVVTLEVPDQVEGLTQVASDGDDHRHRYLVRFDSNGDFVGGVSDVVNGHKHSIRRRSITEMSTDPVNKELADGHFHRYTLLDKLAGRAEEEAAGGIG